MGLFSKKINANPRSAASTILIGGEAGEGIKSAGEITAKALMKSKQYVFVYDEYPSLIRGGHNSVNITYSADPVYSHNREIDVLVCLNQETFHQHKRDIHHGTVILYDPSETKIPEEDLAVANCELLEVNAQNLLKASNFPKILKNTVFTSAALNLLGIEKPLVESIFREQLEGNKLLEQNIEVIQLTYERLKESFGSRKITPSEKPVPTLFMTGNDAIVLGALKGGLHFYAAYPMTPASSILHTLFRYEKSFNVVVKQAEDEIAAINMAVGAAFGGARAMVGTSGGGFSLMVEGLGLAAITETPLVIILSQRPGPATGLPTWTGQSDALFALHASQDEFPRVVLAPTDAEEAFYFTHKALNIAEKYQIPVIILSDRYLSESGYHFTLENLDQLEIDRGLLLSDRILSRLDNYHRFEFTENGISPRSIPGQVNGVFIANSDESDTQGFTDESAENRKLKVEKRFKKLAKIQADLPVTNMYGSPKAAISLLCWGSTKGPVLEAMRRLQTQGIETRLVAINCIEPFPSGDIIETFKNSRKVILIEGNYTAQLGQLIMKNTGFEVKHAFLKYDGRPFHPDEIVTYILGLL